MSVWPSYPEVVARLQIENATLRQAIAEERRIRFAAQTALSQILDQIQTSGTKVVYLPAETSFQSQSADVRVFAERSMQFCEQMRDFAAYILTFTPMDGTHRESDKELYISPKDMGRVHQLEPGELLETHNKENHHRDDFRRHDREKPSNKRPHRDLQEIGLGSDESCHYFNENCCRNSSKECKYLHRCNICKSESHGAQSCPIRNGSKKSKKKRKTTLSRSFLDR